MDSTLIFIIIGVYFLILITISHFTGKKISTEGFFTGERKSPWYIVAFGMIGASLSGVTFISIPGKVGAIGLNQEYAYMQVVFGYILGYLTISYVLLPLYYKMNLTSIYEYLGKRFGPITNKTSSLIFIISRALGAAIRLYLVVLVMQHLLFERLNISFELTTAVTILLIWLYTLKGGIKTVVWTDAFQTLVMLSAVVATIFYISAHLNLTLLEIPTKIQESGLGKMFFFEGGWKSQNFFWKQFLSGAFITIVMTGLDQDMMQKSLTCKNMKDARKNLLSLGFILIPVNLLFLTLGALLFVFLRENGLPIPMNEDGSAAYDLIFSSIATTHIGGAVGVLFLLGLIAAAYSSADSTLTALTTSFSVDFLGVDVKNDSKFTRSRYLIHLFFSVFLFFIIIAVKFLNEDSIVNTVFKIAGYTYGPLLGLFAFGIITKRKIVDFLTIPIAIIAPLITYVLALNSESWFSGYKVGFEVIIINGFICFTLLFLSSLLRNLWGKNEKHT